MHVNTVLGPIPPEQLGFTAMHEHIQWGPAGWQLDGRWWLDPVARFATCRGKLAEFKERGGSALVDLSGIGFGRDVELYAALSRATGVHVVACTGFWAEEGIEPYFQRKDRRYLEELFTREIVVGIGGTGVRAGIVKVGNAHAGFTPFEEDLYRAAVAASRATGVAITTHGSTQARAQARVLLDADVDPSRVVIGHLDAKYALDFERDKELAARGFTVGYDHVGMEPWSDRVYALLDEQRADFCAELIAAGYLDRLIVSCDASAWGLGRPTPLNRVGHLPAFVEKLRARGLGDAELRQIFVDTPRRLLAMGAEAAR